MTVNQSTLDSLKQRAEEYGEQLVTEEATKNALVMPMLMAMGYEPFNPAEVVPEFTADIGTKKGEKVDYAIMRNGKPAILLECKKFGDNLNADRASQLMRYFNVTEAMVGCLTNGVVYKFFTDTDADNVMDEAPFLVVDLYNLNNNAIQGLGQLTKAGFSEDVFKSSAARMRYIAETKSYLAQMLKDPSEDFVKVVARSFYAGLMRQQKVELFTPIVKAGMREFVNEQINNTLRRAVSVAEEAENEIDTETDEDEPIAQDSEKGIITTAEEVEAYDILKDIVGEQGERLSIRDRTSYCSILLDNHHNFVVYRLRFNDPNNKKIGIASHKNVRGVRQYNRYAIDAVSDIAQYSEEIKAAFAAVMLEKDGA